MVEARKMTNDQLMAYLDSPDAEWDLRGHQIVANELLHRHLNEIMEPHWPLTPAFGVAFLAMIAACIAAYPVVKDWILPPQGEKRVGSIQQQPATTPTFQMPLQASQPVPPSMPK